jgi:HlyD family secretion protein
MVPAGAKVARLEVPDLTSQLAQKQAQLAESKANLRRLQAGPRREEVVEQRHKVQRAIAWRDLAKQDLARAREGLAQDVSRLDAQIVQYRAEFDFAQQTLTQSEMLFNKGVLAGQQLMAERKKLQMRQSQVQQAEAEKRAREASGTLTFESELARREKELADTQAALALLEAGGRPEEIEAEQARLARLQEELSYLKGMREKEDVYCSVGGVMTTVRLKEKIGQFFEKGLLIGTVEDIDDLEVEIAMSEQDVAGVEIGQDVELKARALSSQTFTARVDRIAPAAVSAVGDVQSKLAVYCKVVNTSGDLRSGMTGFGRVYRGTKPIGMIVCGKLLRYVRTEFWW